MSNLPSMSGPASIDRAFRPRRSVLSVPGSSPRMLEKAQGLDVDEVFFDLEDAVAPDAKEGARGNVVSAAREGDWSGKTVGVRVNGWTTQWTHRDVVDVVSAAGERIDVLVLPKAESPAHVTALDLLLTQVEAAAGLAVGRIGLEVQIESAPGLVNVAAIA